MRCSRKTTSGFTLVEVMAAGVILGILTIGLTQVWAIAGERSLDSTIRQKAVFVLNGQMERLTALYGRTGFGAVVAVDTTGYGSPAAYPDTRAVFRMDTNGFMNSGLDAFVTDSLATFEAGGEALIYFDNQGGAGDRNFVWIDPDRNVLGRLSWSETVIPAPTGGPPSGTRLCFGFAGGIDGSNCREVALYLEFPFRLIGGAPTEGDTVRIMPLKTIVGRWR